MVTFFCLFESLVIFFKLEPGLVKFTLLGADYFFIPLNIVEFCSGIQLFGNSLIFSSLAFKLC